MNPGGKPIPTKGHPLMTQAQGPFQHQAGSYGPKIQAQPHRLSFKQVTVDPGNRSAHILTQTPGQPALGL